MSVTTCNSQEFLDDIELEQPHCLLVYINRQIKNPFPQSHCVLFFALIKGKLSALNSCSFDPVIVSIIDFVCCLISLFSFVYNDVKYDLVLTDLCIED
ncbi:hypothetical protein L6452_21618 [Arctium lappa]|uniref:Uncharacterized protein n=1 Tax=Arctium lappa TaxID=4217 RepID=A0ACB9AYF7_ARCLA|nr:hypothetical protein L6452_21618 [Arctium lappa]